MRKNFDKKSKEETAKEREKMDPFLRHTLHYFDKAAKILDLPDGMIEWLKLPENVKKVPVPIKTDEGGTGVFMGYRVQHKDVFGPFKGGVRFVPDLNIDQVMALAMDMTWKVRVMNLPLGGAKGGICIDTRKHSPSEIRRATKRYTREIAEIIGPEKDVPAPDMYTNSQTMLWIYDAYRMHKRNHQPGVVTGKPVKWEGIVGRETATGMGAYYIIQLAAGDLRIDIPKCRIIIDGCGNAAHPLLRQLSKDGAKFVGITDSRGGIYNEKGLDVEDIIKRKKGPEKESVTTYKDAEKFENSLDVLKKDCDILILAAKENRITEKNAEDIKAKYIFEPANGPTTPDGHDILVQRGIYAYPDILVSGGGVTVSWFEMCQNRQGYPWTENQVAMRLKEKMNEAYKRVLATRKKYGLKKNDLRMAAHLLAIGEVAEAAEERGFWP